MKYDKDFIEKSIKQLGRRFGVSESFRDVVVCCAYSLANFTDYSDDRENEYLRIINKYNKDEQDLFPKILTALMNEYSNVDDVKDVLGDIYENLNLTKKGAAQFFTPIDVCKVMAKITINDDNYKKYIEEKGYVDVSDPACGSGRNLYASYKELLDLGIDNDKILLIGDDIDLTCCCMTYIQLSLMGANAIVHHADTLSGELFDTFYTISFMNKFRFHNKLNENNKDEDIEK